MYGVGLEFLTVLLVAHRCVIDHWIIYMELKIEREERKVKYLLVELYHVMNI